MERLVTEGAPTLTQREEIVAIYRKTIDRWADFRHLTSGPSETPFRLFQRVQDVFGG